MTFNNLKFAKAKELSACNTKSIGNENVRSLCGVFFLLVFRSMTVVRKVFDDKRHVIVSSNIFMYIPFSGSGNNVRDISIVLNLFFNFNISNSFLTITIPNNNATISAESSRSID